MSTSEREQLLRNLPSVDEVLRHSGVAGLLAEYPRVLVVEAVRSTLSGERRAILEAPAGAGEA